MRNVIGPRIRQLRYEQSLSQSQLAAKCQLSGWNSSRDIIAAIEGRVRCITDIEILKLARALRVHFSRLFPKG